MNYGIPYMGSKSKICESVCSLFPKADHFYDLFGGGFSITHFMIKYRSRDFKNFHFNELRPGICDLVKDSIAGKYNYNVYSPPWVSREDFSRLKEVDPMVKIIWSFGNNGEGYLFGKDIEQVKKSMHMAVVFNEFDEYAKEVFGMEKFRDGFDINAKRLFLKNRIKLLGMQQLEGPEQLERLQQPEQLERLQQLEGLERLQQLEGLERLQQLEGLERLQRLQQPSFYTGSYDEIEINENSVVYCDIPYEGTADYGKHFDKKKFLNWADAQVNPVFISEYIVNDSRFRCIANFKKRSKLSSSKENTLIKTEKVYVNEAGYKKMRGAI